MSDMPLRLKTSSRERFWSGIQAEIYDAYGGVAEYVPTAFHHISMHIGRPVRATCRCEGLLHARLQTPGDIDVVPQGCSARWEDDGPTTFLKVQLSPALVRSAAEGLGLNPDRVALTPQLQVRDPRLQHVCWALVAELERGDPNVRLYAETLGFALAAQLLQWYSRTSGPKIKPRLTARHLRRALDYIGDNLAKNLTLAELADEVGVSPSHFKNLFKESVGMPPHQYIVQRRVHAAVDLLQKGRPPKEVAHELGFADRSHLARCMRRVLGLRPSDFRS